jgi:hypothetical protein
MSLFNARVISCKERLHQKMCLTQMVRSGDVPHTDGADISSLNYLYHNPRTYYRRLLRVRL